MSSPRWKELSRYSACDIADALLKLKVPGAGFLTNITPIPRPLTQPASSPTKILAPASTFLMLPKATHFFPEPSPTPFDTPPSNLPDPKTPYADLTQPSTIVIISQPAEQSCAVVGGIMATRMKILGAEGIVVSGRVRDLDTLRGLGIPVWSNGTSVVGAGAETRFHAKEVTVRVGEAEVRPSDIIMVDEAENGVVAIPRGKVEEVLELLPGLVDADAKVVRDVEAGGSVKEAFAKYRG